MHSSVSSVKDVSIVLIIVCLISLLVGCGSTSQTPPSPGTILYRANWQNGLNEWNGSLQWKTNQGILISDGSTLSLEPARAAIFAPYHPVTGNYTVEASIRMNTIKGCDFALLVRQHTHVNSQGFVAGYGAHLSPSTLEISPSQIFLSYAVILNSGQGEEGFGKTTVTYKPDTAWHTYRFEANKDMFRFFMDGRKQFQEMDNRIQSGDVGIYDYRCQLQIKSFQVIAL